MKYTVRLIIAALAASAALVSCTKDLTPGKADTDQTAGALRTINVSFDTPTKSYLEGNQPRFSKGDSVLVSDGKALDTCAVDTLMNGQRVIRTKLEGTPLKAVYPYTAASLSHDVEVVGIKIPSVQTGKFADANICMANQSSQTNQECLIFHNRVAILKFYADESIEVDTIRIISDSKENIASDADTIVVTAPKVENSQPSNPTQDPRIWYVAMNNVKDATSLTFESVTKTQGTVTKKPKEADDRDNGILDGYIYNAFIPYYIEVKVSDSPETYQKWAYCNVGAFLPEEPGEYFMWGEVKGHKAVKGAFDFTGFAPFSEDRDRYMKADPEKGFHQDNAPYYEPGEDGKFTKYVTTAVTALELCDDAANANWGGNWRMPEANELGALISGGALSDGDFLRPVGSGENLELKSAITYYWSRNNHDKEVNFATALDISNSPATTAVERWKGCPIRPIYDETLSGDQPATVTISAYTSGGTL